MVVRTMAEAWKIADEQTSADYEYDAGRSARAGYPVYYTTAEGATEYICDLGDRLEVNRADGQTVNIWIKSDLTDDEKREIRAYIDDFLYRLEDNFSFNPALDRYGLRDVMKRLDAIWDELGGVRT